MLKPPVMLFGLWIYLVAKLANIFTVQIRILIRQVKFLLFFNSNNVGYFFFVNSESTFRNMNLPAHLLFRPNLWIFVN